MSDADPTIQYVTLVSDGLSVGGITPTPYEFNNRLQVPLQFDTSNVQVALHSLSYEIDHTTTNYQVAVMSDIVTAEQLLGGELTSCLAVATLTQNNVEKSGQFFGEYNPNRYKWVNASCGTSVNSIAVIIQELTGYNNPPQAADFMLGRTVLTLAFRTHSDSNY